MAFTSEDDVKKVLQGGAQSQTPGIDPTGSTAGGASGGAFVGGGAGGAAPGTAVGGAKPFVNIQSYLQGNQPTESEANIIQSDASKIVGQEKDSLGQAVSATKAQGEAESKEKIGVSDATKIVQDAAKGQGDTSAIRQSLDATFDRPEFNYSMGNQFQGAQEAFNVKPQQYANQAYGRAVDGSLSQGQRLLQGQLDAVNPFVQESLQGAGTQFKDTQDYIGNQTDEIGNYINELAQTYMGADEALRSGLSGYGGQQYSTAQSEMERQNQERAAQVSKYEDYLRQNEGALGQINNAGRADRERYGTSVDLLNQVLGDHPYLNSVLQGGNIPYDFKTVDSALTKSGYSGLGAQQIHDAIKFNNREAQRQQGIGSYQTKINQAKQSDLGEDYNIMGASPDAVAQYRLISELLGQPIDLPTAGTGRGAKLTF